MSPLAAKSAAWAAEMRAAQDEALPTAVVDGEGTGIYLMSGAADEDLLDSDPAPGIQPRWLGKGKTGDMRRVVDRKLGQPQVTVLLPKSVVTGEGSFAGPVGTPFTICHLAGNKFRVTGGQLTFSRLVGFEPPDDEGYTAPIYGSKTIAVPDTNIFADPGKTTVLGFLCTYAKATTEDALAVWDLDFTFDTRKVPHTSPAVTDTVCGMRTTFSGTVPSPIYANFTPIGDPFFPWISLHTQSDKTFWKYQIGQPPVGSYLDPARGFFWWQ
jgi:hypothetical protein